MRHVEKARGRRRFSVRRGTGIMAPVLAALLLALAAPMDVARGAQHPPPEEKDPPKEPAACATDPRQVLPLEQWQKWTEQEIWVWEQACVGQIADFNQADSEQYGGVLDPKREQPAWPETRVLRPEFLNAILRTKQLRESLRGKGLRISGAWIREPLDLSNAVLDHELWLDRSRFERRVRFTRIRSSRLISLEGSVFEDILNMNALRVGADLLMRGVEAFNPVLLIDAQVDGLLVFSGSTFDDRLDLNGVQVGSSMMMDSGARFQEVVLRGAKIRDLLVMDGSDIAGPLNMGALQVGSNLFMRKGRFGTTVLRNGKVGDTLDMGGAVFNGPLNMDGLSVGSDLRMHGKARFRAVRMVGAKVGNVFNLSNSVFAGTLNMEGLDAGSVLSMKRASFQRVVLRNAKVGGAVRVERARFAETLNMDNLQLRSHLLIMNVEGRGLNLRNARVGGRMEIAGSQFQEPLHLDRMEVGSGLYIRNSIFDAPLNMEGLRVGASLYITDGARLEGLNMQNANVRDELVFSGATFGRTVNMDRLRAGSNVLMEKDTAIMNLIRLRFATIGQNLDLSGGVLAGMDLTNARIGGDLRLAHPGGNASAVWNPQDAKLILRNTQVGTVRDAAEAWPERLELDGFTYVGWIRGGVPLANRDVSEIIAWLMRQENPSLAPYLQLAKVLRAAGEDSKAEDILYAGKLRGHGRSSGVRFAWLSLQLIIIGYGHRVWLAAIWTLAFVLLGAWAFARSSEGGKSTIPYRVFYSLDMLLPIIQLRNEHYTFDLTGKIAVYFYFHKIMGYVLVTFLIAGLSGLV